MKRRDFLKVASGSAGGAAAVGTAAASSGSSLSLQEGNETSGGNESGSGSDAGGGGGTEIVDLVNYKYVPGTDSPLYITPGTTVKFVWKTSTHNIVVDSQPDGADWQGHETVEEAGFTYEHTFEVKGTYEFHCQPHLGLGMKGTIVVNDSGAAPVPEGPVELSPHEMGVPFQAHYVGIATILMMFVSLVFTFFTLKYGESRNTSAPNKR